MKKYKDFTAVIPAGGKGSRFDKKINKSLFKIKNKTIFEIILNKVILLTNKIIIVTSTKNDIGIKKICKLKKYNKINFIFILQKKPDGMGMALNLAIPKITTSYFFLIWSDQLGITYKTMVDTLEFFLF